jgi:hypothetical protein
MRYVIVNVESDEFLTCVLPYGSVTTPDAEKASSFTEAAAREMVSGLYGGSDAWRVQSRA